MFSHTLGVIEPEAASLALQREISVQCIYYRAIRSVRNQYPKMNYTLPFKIDYIGRSGWSGGGTNRRDKAGDCCAF